MVCNNKVQVNGVFPVYLLMDTVSLFNTFPELTEICSGKILQNLTDFLCTESPPFLVYWFLFQVFQYMPIILPLVWGREGQVLFNLEECYPVFSNYFIYTLKFPSADNMYRRHAALGKIALGKHQIIMVSYGENSNWYQSLQYLNFLHQKTDPRDRVHHLRAASMLCVREAEMR